MTFHLSRPQPALLALLASGYSPVYPCHVSRRDMRTHPIGTGPFKFVEFKPERSRSGWCAIRTIGSRAGRIWTRSSTAIITNRANAMLAFIAGQFDMTFAGEFIAASW